MIAYPAIDLRGGRAVQWVGGRPDTEQVSLPDPLAIADRFVAAGFAALHVVDLDAALGTGDNRTLIHSLIAAVPVPVQVGGGLRSDRDVDAMIEAGAARVILGTRAVADGAWLAARADAHPARVVVAADCRDGEVVTHGWTAGTGRSAAAFVAALGGLPLAGLLVTDVSREGRLGGTDVPFLAALGRATPHPLIAAGGIRGLQDLADLAAAGIAGAVLGMALYTGDLDLSTIAKEHST